LKALRLASSIEQMALDGKIWQQSDINYQYLNPLPTKSF